MISRRDLLAASALLGTSSLSWAAADYKEGKQYLRVMPPVPTQGDKIEVVEFFAYTCSHCYQYAPMFHEWEKTAPADVVVRRCPVAWNQDTIPFVKAYYALEALGELDRLDMPFFESVVKQLHPYHLETADQDIRDFMVSHGVDGKKWDATVRSFAVNMRTRQATQLWQAYQIDSTPSIGIAGQYVTGPAFVGSRKATAAAIDYVVDLVRKQR